MDLAKLKQFATDRQCQIIDAVNKCGTQKKAAIYLKINPRTLARSLESAKKSLESC